MVPVGLGKLNHLPLTLPCGLQAFGGLLLFVCPHFAVSSSFDIIEIALVASA